MAADITSYPSRQAKRRLRQVLSGDSGSPSRQSVQVDMQAAARFLVRTFADHPDLFSLADGKLPEAMPDLEHITQVRTAVEAYAASSSPEPDEFLAALLDAVCALTTMHRMSNLLERDNEGEYFITPSGQRDLEVVATYMDSDTARFPTPPEGCWRTVVSSMTDGLEAHGAILKHVLDEAQQGICEALLQAPARNQTPVDGLPDLSAIRFTLAQRLTQQGFSFSTTSSNGIT